MMNGKTTTTARVLAMLAVAVASGGCAMKGDIRLLQEELRLVSARQDSLMAQIRVETLQTQDTLRVQGDQMFDLRGDLNRQLQQISQMLVRIEALAGENQRGLMQVRDQLANGRGASGGAPGGPTRPAGGGGENLLGGAGGPDELWQVAQAQGQRGSLNSASRAFQDFIDEYPDDERVPNAHFFIADILTQQERPEDALEAFQEIQRLYPTHEKVPEALYRIGMLQLELDDSDAAKETFERIVNTYPESMVAMLARDELDKIG
jgi:tol-pal system protein YbgF